MNNKIIELKTKDLLEINGGMRCEYIIHLFLDTILPSCINLAINMKAIRANNNIRAHSFHIINPSQSKTSRFIKKAKNILLFWKGSKDRFGFIEDGRFL